MPQASHSDICTYSWSVAFHSYNTFNNYLQYYHLFKNDAILYYNNNYSYNAFPTQCIEIYKLFELIFDIICSGSFGVLAKTGVFKNCLFITNQIAAFQLTG